MALQSDWRFCQKCAVMFFNGRPNKGHCPAGGGHSAQGFMFMLPHDVGGTPTTQRAWRFCQKCTGMFYDGRPDKGHCPAGGAHEAEGFVFVLPHGVPGNEHAQTAWRFCQKCTGMFYDGRSDKGRCPAGGGHEAQGFGFVLPHDLEWDNPELGNPTGGDSDKPTPPNDPPPEDGPTKNPDNLPPPPQNGGCFLGNTTVLMADGLCKRIDALKIGDRVMARDEATGHIGAGSVERVFRHEVEQTWLLRMKSGEIVETTAQHRFAAEERGFLRAGALRPGDRLSTYTEVSMEIVASQGQQAAATVYNLSVERFHTFFVGGAELWVHNEKDNKQPTDQPPTTP